MSPKTRLEDVDLLIDVLRRSPLLEELQRDTLNRRQLQDRLGISRATSHRYTRLLGDLGLVEKSNGEFRLTDSGRLLTDTIVDFKRDAQTALQLTPLLDAVRNAPVEIDIEAFADATVTNTEHGDPHSPVVRFIKLVRNSDSLRGFDIDTIAPLYMDEIQQRIVRGMETDVIAVPEVSEEILHNYPDKCTAACASSHLTVRLHGDLPFGLALFDERVVIAVCVPETRQLQVCVDTCSPAVRKWAEDVYEAYKTESVRMEQFTREGFAVAKTNLQETA